MSKKIYILFIFFCFTLASCEKVIDLKLETAPAKIVIDANLYVNEENTNRIQTITLTKTTGFYEQGSVPVLDAKVWIQDDLGNFYEFIDYNQNGEYQIEFFDINLNANYELYVISEGETYRSKTKFYDTPEIVEIEQNNDGGLLGDSYEFKFWFQDNDNQQNYYQLKDVVSFVTRFNILDDTYSNGKLMNAILVDSDLKSGDMFYIEFSEVSKEYFLYMEKTLSISQNIGNPFAPPIGEIRGNIINTTNASNYPLGFFSLHKTVYKNIVVE